MPSAPAQLPAPPLDPPATVAAAVSPSPPHPVTPSSSHFLLASLDALIGLLLVALLTFTVLAFGTVDAWSEAVAVELGGGIAACLAVRLMLRPRERLPR